MRDVLAANIELELVKELRALCRVGLFVHDIKIREVHMGLDSLEDLYVEELKDLYNAEKQLLRTSM